jgi:hypothetical protein
MGGWGLHGYGGTCIDQNVLIVHRYSIVWLLLVVARKTIQYLQSYSTWHKVFEDSCEHANKFHQYP